MPAVAFYGCICSGHGCHPPRANDQASPDVFVNNLGVHRKSDHWVKHKCGKNTHDGVLSGGSSTVFVNNIAIGRIGDSITCGSIIAQGSPTVFSG